MNTAGDQRAEPGRRAAIDQLLNAAVSMLGSAVVAASVTYRAGTGRPRTLASTGQPASLVDEMQYRAEQGPCLDALSRGEPSEPVRSDDLRVDSRWPQLGAALGQSGERRAASVLSMPLPLPSGDGGSLNLYSADVHAWHAPHRVSDGQDAAAVLALGLGNLLVRRRADHLEVALDSNRQIGAAVGVLMTRYRWTYDQAFTMLRGASQQHHRKLRDLADDVLYTGVLPAESS